MASSKVAKKKVDGYFRTSTVCTKSIRPPPSPSNPDSLVFDNNLTSFYDYKKIRRSSVDYHHIVFALLIGFFDLKKITLIEPN